MGVTAVASIKLAKDVPSTGDLGEQGETVLLESDDAVLVQTEQVEEEDEEVQLKSGYTSGTVSDDEEEDADEVVLREIEKRGAKEGYVYSLSCFSKVGSCWRIEIG